MTEEECKALEATLKPCYNCNDKMEMYTRWCNTTPLYSFFECPTCRTPSKNTTEGYDIKAVAEDWNKDPKHKESCWLGEGDSNSHPVG